MMYDAEKNYLLRITAFLGMLGVILGAFGAHGLKDSITSDLLSTYKTGVSYHMYHVLAMLGCAVWMKTGQDLWIKRAFYAFLIGVILFSGSLYLLSTRDVLGITSYRWLGPVTPIGGLFFVVGWLSLFISTMRKNARD